MTAQEYLNSLQSGQGLGGATSNEVVIGGGPSRVPAGSCQPSGPTTSTAIDANKLFNASQGEVQFDVTNAAGEGAEPSRIMIGGGYWYPGIEGRPSRATSIDYPAPAGTSSMEDDINVITDFGDNPTTFAGSLVAWDALIKGALVNGVCIRIQPVAGAAGPRPRLRLVKVDENLEVCHAKVLSPICRECPDDSDDVLCYDVCFIADNQHWLEVTLPIGADYEVTLSTPAFDSISNLTPHTAC